jgi:hypothetical protein
MNLFNWLFGKQIYEYKVYKNASLTGVLLCLMCNSSHPNQIWCPLNNTIMPRLKALEEEITLLKSKLQ